MNDDQSMKMRAISDFMLEKASNTLNEFVNSGACEVMVSMLKRLEDLGVPCDGTEVRHVQGVVNGFMPIAPVLEQAVKLKTLKDVFTNEEILALSMFAVHITGSMNETMEALMSGKGKGNPFGDASKN